MNRILPSAFAFASTVAAVISLGATASGSPYAQPLLAQHSGSAYFGPFGEPPLVIKDTSVMGSAAMPTVEPVEGNPEIIKTTFGQPPLVIKDTAVMGGAAMPTVEPFESNFPETKPAQ